MINNGVGNVNQTETLNETNYLSLPCDSVRVLRSLERVKVTKRTWRRRFSCTSSSDLPLGLWCTWSRLKLAGSVP